MATGLRSPLRRASCSSTRSWTWVRGESSGSPSTSTLDGHHDAKLAHAALSMAVAVRGGKQAITAVIMHTDQGSEYTAKIFRAACGRMDIKQSMGRVGSALDNAVIESWHSTLEFELRRLEHFATKAQARARVAAWIDEYNRDRKHSSIGMRSPIDYELALHAGEPDEPTAAA